MIKSANEARRVDRSSTPRCRTTSTRESYVNILPSFVDDMQPQIHLIRDCWSEDPTARPAIGQIRTLMRTMGGR